MVISKNKIEAQKASVLLVAVISAFLTAYMGSAITLALPSIGSEFDADAILISWISTVYLLSSAIFIVPFGRLADIYGRKRLFLSGMIIFTVSSLVASIAPGIYFLLACRVIQGVGSSIIFATGIAIVTSVFPLSERGKALGFTIAAVYAGLSFGPFAGGFFTDYFGWRSIFIFTALIGFTGIWFLVGKVEGEWADAAGEPFDLSGSFIYGISLALFITGLSRLPLLSGIIFLIAGISGIFLFIFFELRTRFPVMQLDLFRNNAVFRWSNIAALINYSATFAIGFILSLYLQYVKEFSARDAGLILIFQPVVMAVVSLVAGRLSDRIEPRILATAGMTLNSLGLLIFGFIQNMNIPAIIANLVLLGFGFGLFASPNSNAIMSSVSKKFYGIASGSMNTMRLIGQMVSMGIIMFILTLFIGREPVSELNKIEFIQSVRVAFLLFFALCFAGIFASYARGKIRG